MLTALTFFMYDVSLPPSSKTVLQLLDEAGAMTHKEIVRKSNLAPRTVRYALKKLKDNHLIIEKFNFRDARQIIYQNREPQQVAA
jgi:predicted transcriptional regulator